MRETKCSINGVSVTTTLRDLLIDAGENDVVLSQLRPELAEKIRNLSVDLKSEDWTKIGDISIQGLKISQDGLSISYERDESLEIPVRVAEKMAAEKKLAENLEIFNALSLMG